MLWYDIIGIVGSVLLSIQNFPQIYLIYQKKNIYQKIQSIKTHKIILKYYGKYLSVMNLEISYI